MTICLAFVFFLCFLDSSHGGLCRKTTSFAVSKRHATSQDAVGHLRALHAAGGVRAFTEYQVTRWCKTYNEQLFLNRNYVPFIHSSIFSTSVVYPGQGQHESKAYPRSTGCEGRIHPELHCNKILEVKTIALSLQKTFFP